MRSNCFPVCLRADNMPFFYVTPHLSLWPDDGTTLYVIILEVYILSSIYLFLIATLANYSNPTNVLKFLVALSLFAIAFFIDQSRYPSSLLLSVLFVDNLQVCTPNAVCSFVWLCVHHGHRECICTDVRFDFQSPCPLFYIVQTWSHFPPLSYSGFSNHRGSLLPPSRVKCSFFVIYYLLLLRLCTFFVLPHHTFLLICVVCCTTIANFTL